MVHVHAAQAQQLAQATRGVDPAEVVAVPVDVGKHAAMALVCDFTGELLGRCCVRCDYVEQRDYRHENPSHSPWCSPAVGLRRLPVPT